MSKSGSPNDAQAATQPEAHNSASNPSPPQTSWRRWLAVAVFGAAAVGGYFGVQAMTAGDAVVTTNNDIKFSATPVANAANAAGEAKPAGIVKGGITDLLNNHPVEEAENPLDPLLLVAEKGLEELRETLVDYTATIERQERVGGKLMPTETINLKIRQAQEGDEDGNPAVSRAIYTTHLAPKSMEGQEAIWVEDQNDGNIVAHPPGMFNLKRFYLHPEGFLAMRGSRYPITEAGFEVLIERMLERGRRDRKYGTCEVKVDREATINGRSCTAFEIVHEKQEGPYDFHIARIFIDDELNLPIHYEAHIWPEKEGGEPQLLERYTYTDIKINPGLTEADFDPSNPAYDYVAE